MFKEPFSICPRVFLSNEIVAATVETLVLFNITGLVNANYPQCDCHYLVDESLSNSPNSQSSTLANGPSFSYYALCLDGTGEWKSPTISPEGSEVKMPGLCDQLEGFFEYADSVTVNGSLLIYCKGGQKSSVLAMAFLMRQFKCGCREAYQYLQSKSPLIQPNLILVNELLQYEEDMLGINTRQGDQRSFQRMLPANFHLEHSNAIDEEMSTRIETCIIDLIQNKTKNLEMMKTINANDIYSTLSRKVILRLIRNRLDQQLAILSPKRMEVDGEVKSATAKKKGNRFVLPTPEKKKSDEAFFENFLSFLVDFQIFIETILSECQFLLGLPGLVDYAEQSFYTRDDFDGVAIVTRFLLHLLTSEIDETHKIAFLFQLLKQLSTKTLISQFRQLFLPQFAFYTHQKLINEESKNYLMHHLYGSANLAEFYLQVKDIILDSVSTTYSRKLDSENCPIASFQVTSFENSKWPQDYYLGNYSPENASRAIDAITPVHLPPSMATAFELYADEFHRDYPDRKLKLIPHFGFGEMLYRISNDRNVALIATTLQIIVIETIGSEELSFVDIQEHCRILIPDLVSTLLSLLVVRRNCQNAILLRKAFLGEGKNIHKKDLFKLNSEFKCAAKSIDLSKPHK